MVTVLVAVLFVAATATASGPPVVNSTTHSFNEPFGGVGLNCASGNLALSDGVFSGVIHRLVQADGSIHIVANTRGIDSLDDLPADDTIDATTTFVFNSNDIFFANASEVHHFTGTGTLTVTATGAVLRFQVIIQMVIDRDGNPRLDLLHFVCE
jgi:hypothetical protein